MIKGMKFVSLPSRDQDAALAFWTEKMGFAVATDQPLGNQRWIELRIPGADTRLVLFTPDGQEDSAGGSSNVSFWTDDIDATYAEMQAKGVETLGAPKKMEWGASLMFKDADGGTHHVGSK